MKVVRALKESVSTGQLEQLAGQLTELFNAREDMDSNFDALLAGKLQELFGYKKEDSCAFFNALLIAVDSVRNGSTVPAPVVEPRFPKWRPFLAGEADPRALLSLIPEDSNVRQLLLEHLIPAYSNVKQLNLCKSQGVDGIDTVILTPRDSGFTEEPTMDELFDPLRLTTWSEVNASLLPQGYEVGLIPAKPSLHVCIQYRSQKYKDQAADEEVLALAMERVHHPEYGESIFEMGVDRSGERWFRAVAARSEDRCNLDRRFVFGLYRIVQELRQV